MTDVPSPDELQERAHLTRQLIARLAEAANENGQVEADAAIDAIVRTFRDVDTTVAAIIDQMNAITERLNAS